MSVLEKQRQVLEQKRDATLTSLQAATTQSDVEKYSAALRGVNGALATIAARANELAQRSALQQQQLNAGQAIQRQQTTETTAASFGQDVNTSIGALKLAFERFRCSAALGRDVKMFRAFKTLLVLTLVYHVISTTYQVNVMQQKLQMFIFPPPTAGPSSFRVTRSQRPIFSSCSSNSNWIYPISRRPKSRPPVDWPNRAL